MLKNEEDTSKFHRAGPGWSSLHSWIFLAVVAFGLVVIGLQNRYYYLSPLGLGKAYRIDKLFGGIQEFDPVKGWVVAIIPPPPMPSQPPQSMSMMEPPAMTPGSATVPMNMPGMMAPPSVSTSPGRPQLPMVEKQEAPSQLAKEDLHEEPQQTFASPKREAPVEMTQEQKLEAFKKSFPDYGKDEFQLASDDLYPDWKKKVAPDGTWSEFLTVYGDFVQWWSDQGSPAEAGFKLWNDFLAGKTKH